MSQFPYDQGQYHDGSANMNHTYDYMCGQTSSPTLLQHQFASPSQSLPTELPDLYYDRESMPTPPSASSSNMICTTPEDWQIPWQPTVSKCGNNPPYLPPTWQSSSLSPCHAAPPTISPIDTDYDCARQQFSGGEQQSHLRFDYNTFSAQECDAWISSSYPQPLLLTQPITDFNFASSTSPISETVSPAVLSEPLPASSNYLLAETQAPMELHQPRPSRRIPIISLSKLASACDDASIKSHRKEPKAEDVLSPLYLDLNSHSSMPSFTTPNHYEFIQQSLHSTNYTYNSTFPFGSDEVQKAISCNCGCMESLSFRL